MTSALRVARFAGDPTLPALRVEALIELLRGVGVELQVVNLAAPDFPDGGATSDADRLVNVVRHAIDWADVVLLDLAAGDPLSLDVQRLLAVDPGLIRDRALVGDLAAWPTPAARGAGAAGDARQRRQCVQRLLSRADLITVATPPLADLASRHGDIVRLLRDAIVPAWYATGTRNPVDLAGDPRIIFAAPPRLVGGYAICRDAVDEVRRQIPSTRLAWLALADALTPADEVLGNVDEPAERAWLMTRLRPEIGLAPLDARTARATTEVRWLEYTMAGAVTIASSGDGRGPYDVIVDGRDGLVAGSGAAWRDSLLRLAGSAGLRAELLGRARERVLAEYDVRQRAPMWGDALRWASEHAGRGRLQKRSRGRQTQAIEEQARLASARRVRRRQDDAEARTVIAALRGGRQACADSEPGTATVSAILVLTDASIEAAHEAVASIVRQSRAPDELIVVSSTPDRDPRQLTAALDASFPCQVVQFSDLSPTTGAPDARWAAGMNAGLARATGRWVAPLSDWRAWMPTHLEVLVEAALAGDVELAYGQVLAANVDGAWSPRGGWPPAVGRAAADGAIFAAALRALPFDPDAHLGLEGADAARWRRLVAGGTRIAGIDQPVVASLLVDDPLHAAAGTGGRWADLAALATVVGAPARRDPIPGGVAAIATFYGRPELVERVAAAIRAQTRPPDELWLMYEGGVGETLAVTDFGVTPFLLEIPTPRTTTGRYAVIPYSLKINRALDASGCDYIVYVTDDSIADPRKFEVMARALDEHPDYGAVYCSQEHEGGTRAADRPIDDAYCIVDHTQVMHRRTLDRWSLDVRHIRLGDATFWRALHGSLGPFQPIAEILDTTRPTGSGITATEPLPTG